MMLLEVCSCWVSRGQVSKRAIKVDTGADFAQDLFSGKPAYRSAHLRISHTLFVVLCECQSGGIQRSRVKAA